MASIVIVETMENFFKIFGDIFCSSPLCWCPHTKSLKKQTSFLKLAIWFIVFFYTALTNIGLIGLMIIQLYTPFMSASHLVLFAFAILGFSLSVTFSTYIYRNSSSLIAVLRNIVALDQKLTDKYVCPSERNGFQRLKMIVKLFNVATGIALFISVVGPVAIAFTNFSPVVFLLETRLKAIDCLPIRIIVALSLILGHIHLWAPVLFLTYYTIGYEYFIGPWLKLISAKEEQGRKDFLKTKNYLRLHPKIGIKIHRALRVMNDYGNEEISNKVIATPLLLLVPGLMGILCSFVSVKMRNMIPMPGYAAFPLISILVLVLENIGIHNAFMVHINSTDFIQEGKHNVDLHYRKLIKACYPIKLNVGPFFSFKRSTTMCYLEVFVAYTMNLILAVELKS